MLLWVMYLLLQLLFQLLGLSKFRPFFSPLSLSLPPEILATTEITLEKITKYQFLISSKDLGCPMQQKSLLSATESRVKEEKRQVKTITPALEC